MFVLIKEFLPKPYAAMFVFIRSKKMKMRLMDQNFDFIVLFFLFLFISFSLISFCFYPQPDILQHSLILKMSCKE